MFRHIRAVLLVLAALAGTPLATAQVTFTQSAINSGDTSTTSITAADFDNDGILDLVTVNINTLSFYKGLGRALWASPVNSPLPQFLGQVFAADFDRDGELDLAISSTPFTTPRGVTLLLGNGDGTFRPGTDIPVTGNAGYIALADFNGDHWPDIAVSICADQTSCNVTEVFLGTGDGVFTLSAALNFGGSQIIAGDFDADGHQDLAVISGDTVVVYLGLGDGTFHSPVPAPLSSVSSIAVGDFYNNRLQSLAALVTIFLGDGSFVSWVYSLRYSQGELLIENQHLINPNSGDPYQRLVAGDLNGDFKDDLFLVGGNVTGSSVSGYMLGNGDGTFQAPVDAPHWMDLQNFPFIRDLDGDSRHDVGIAWTSIFDNIGGAEILHDSSATTNCKPPKANLLNVHICTPTAGQQVGKTFIFRAAGNAWNGYAKRMELWIDGKKVAQNLQDQLRAKVNLPRGNHTAAFVVVDSFDSYVAKSVKFKASY